MNTTRENGPAYLAAFLYAIIIGFSFLFVKMTVSTAHPLDVLAHRFALSFFAASIPVIFGWMPVRIKRKDLWPIVRLALLSPVLFFAFQAFGLMNASSSEAGIIQASVPVFTLLLASYFLKERSSGLQKVSLLISVAGVIFIFAMKGGSLLGSGNFQGISLLLLSALSFAGYSVLARPLTRTFKPMELTYITLGVGFILFNIMAVGRHSIDGSLNEFFQPLADIRYIGALLYLGILSTMVTTLLSSFALSRIEASKMSVFSNFCTLVSMAAGALFLNEQLRYYHVIGAVMIILGVLGTNFLGNKRGTIDSTKPTMSAEIVPTNKKTVDQG
ncbi:DMT family transporter [Paenibacillus macquariensis]|uniref:Permease of the drug/metabolite transporter (DMT) superfamily n=1 Tax=Paenibacillus macquariensis TaxID=948756 RepID=A0ABY1KBQ4_9BACL|nr:DMT family transporter [Paenibacillus macquariensis]MEC0093553.1 DMT family transporter [Paenibacillus macquariensis]OAB29839.1 transporter [Paenibacillus macquariensis subsp. macquariensis]SIR56577.1 Permease of the drug/metabolite transporter (DMT) superfamily [Paenibacillus macquariensis]